MINPPVYTTSWALIRRYKHEMTKCNSIWNKDNGTLEKRCQDSGRECSATLSIDTYFNKQLCYGWLVLTPRSSQLNAKCSMSTIVWMYSPSIISNIGENINDKCHNL